MRHEKWIHGTNGCINNVDGFRERIHLPLELAVFVATTDAYISKRPKKIYSIRKRPRLAHTKHNKG